MFRNTTFTPPIGKMTTLLKSQHKAGIRKSNFAVCMDLIIKFEFLRLVAKCAMGVFCVPKPLVGGFGCDEVVLYGIRELA